MQLFTYSMAGCSVVKTGVRPDGRKGGDPFCPWGRHETALALPLLQRTRRDLTAEVSGRGEICEISRDMLQGTLRDARIATTAEQAAPESRAAARVSGGLEPGRRRDKQHMRRSSRKLASAAQALNPPPPYSARWDPSVSFSTDYVVCLVCRDLDTVSTSAELRQWQMMPREATPACRAHTCLPAV